VESFWLQRLMRKTSVTRAQYLHCTSTVRYNRRSIKSDCLLRGMRLTSYLIHAIEKTAAEHVQPVINRYHGQGLSPHRVDTQTRSTPRAESSIGIGYLVTDKQESPMWSEQRRVSGYTGTARHGHAIINRARPDLRENRKTSLCAPVTIPAWLRHRRLGVPHSTPTVTIVPVLTAGTVTARESGHLNWIRGEWLGQRRVTVWWETTLVFYWRRGRFVWTTLVYSRLLTLVPRITNHLIV